LALDFVALFPILDTRRRFERASLPRSPEAIELPDELR